MISTAAATVSHEWAFEQASKLTPADIDPPQFEAGDEAATVELHLSDDTVVQIVFEIEPEHTEGVADVLVNGVHYTRSCQVVTGFETKIRTVWIESSGREPIDLSWRRNRFHPLNAPLDLRDKWQGLLDRLVSGKHESSLIGKLNDR